MRVSSGNRALYLGLGALSGVVIVVILSVALKVDSLPAKLLLDHRTGTQVFPFPFSIQNIMWVLLGLGIGDVLFRMRQAKHEANACTLSLLPEDDRTVLTARDMQPVLEKARKAGAGVGYYQVELIDQCVNNFQASGSTSQAHEMLSSMVELEMHRVDLRFTLLRYLGWLIPTIGFIGTVVGIAGALEVLKGGMEGISQKMDALVGNLGTAFFSTILALCFSAVLVLATQLAQKREEEAINASSDYCLRNLINRLYVPPAGE